MPLYAKVSTYTKLNFQRLTITIFILDLLSSFSEAVLTGTHNLCYRTKIRKIDIPLYTPVLLYIKAGYKGVYISRTCFPDVTGAVSAFRRSDLTNNLIISFVKMLSFSLEHYIKNTFHV